MAPDMIIHTNTERVKGSRKIALELLLSDHVGDCRPPCALACPAQTDCQGYVGLIANGQYKEAVELIKEKITASRIHWTFMSASVRRCL